MSTHSAGADRELVEMEVFVVPSKAPPSRGSIVKMMGIGQCACRRLICCRTKAGSRLARRSARSSTASVLSRGRSGREDRLEVRVGQREEEQCGWHRRRRREAEDALDVRDHPAAARRVVGLLRRGDVVGVGDLVVPHPPPFVRLRRRLAEVGPRRVEARYRSISSIGFIACTTGE